MEIWRFGDLVIGRFGDWGNRSGCPFRVPNHQITRTPNHQIAKSRDTIIRLSLILLLAAAGCQPYTLRGTVLRGATPGVIVVDQDDGRLQQPGLVGAVVDLTLDPSSLGAKQVAADVTDEQGQFTLKVDEFGAGFLEYDFGVLARLQGHSDVWQEMRLPSSGKRLLVIMTPGQGTVIRPGDALRETLREAERLERK